jgi:uncharacterized membrane protein
VAAGAHDDQCVLTTLWRLGMRLTFRTLCLLIAVILFVIATLGVDVRGISLVALGLAFFAGSFLVPETVISRRP